MKINKKKITNHTEIEDLKSLEEKMIKYLWKKVRKKDDTGKAFFHFLYNIPLTVFFEKD